MTHILIATGSARKGRAADGILKAVLQETENINTISVSVADIAALNLPFFNNENPPSSPDFVETNENVTTWRNQVSAADAVILLVPEYNHTLSAIQKNSIDWLYSEWNGKPILPITYGWYGGKHSLVTLREIASTLKMDLKDPVQLTFEKDIETNGNLIDTLSVTREIRRGIDSLL